MLENFQTFNKNDKSSLILNSKGADTFKFDKDSKFKLLISNQPIYDKNCSYFSKIIFSGIKSLYFFNNISSKEVIQNISDKSIQNNIINLTSYDYINIFDEKNLESKAGEKNEYQVSYEMLKLNVIFPDKYCVKHGKNFLVKFDLNDKNMPFILDKNIIYNTFLCTFDRTKNEENNNFKNVCFSLEIKKIIKAIQVRLENLQQKGIKQLNDEIFVQLLAPNMGIIISQNPNNPKLNLETMKTNFNSIVKQKFILKSIFISFFISLSLDDENLKINKNQYILINDPENVEKKSDSLNDDITSCGSSNNYNSPKISGSEKDPQEYNNKIIPFKKLNTFSVPDNNDLPNGAKFIPNIPTKYGKKSSIDISYNINKMGYKFPQEFSLPKPKRKSYHKKIFNEFNYNGNITFLNSSNIFSKTLFNRYQDKSNSTCNFQILQEFLKIKLNQPFEELNLHKFFNSFSRISSLSLKIPFFKLDGGIIEKTLTPSLKEIKLVIKNSKLLKKIKKKYLQKISSNNSLTEKEIELNINGFAITILEYESIVKITYNERRPYYLTESLNDKLEQLINISKFIKKINIKESVIINQSFMSVEWNFINGNNIFSSSFTSYYLFNCNLLGILSDIKEKEYFFWLNIIQERKNKNIKFDYNNIIYENYNNIVSFINGINR